MVFRSSEIRWFSDDAERLREIYKQLPETGTGRQEGNRTDFYLRSNLTDTGIKVREGNHELKLKSAPDESLAFGVVQHWIKWSHCAEDSILDTIDQKFLQEWIAVGKTRFKKSYEINNHNRLIPVGEELVQEGCGVEFTEVSIPSLPKVQYTLGLEAFSATQNARSNLFAALDYLDINFSQLKTLDSFSYPEWIAQVLSVG